MLSTLLSSKSRAEILRILFDGTNPEKYLREIEKLTDITLNSLQKELKLLSSIDVITSRKDGNRVYYAANTNHPIYLEIVSMVAKTVGIVGQLTSHLSSSEIKYAFIFGSIANQKETSSSDIDLIVIGTISMRSLSKLLAAVQENTGREVNPHIFTEDEFKKRLDKKNHFVSSLMKTKWLPIIGDVDGFRNSATQRNNR